MVRGHLDCKPKTVSVVRTDGFAPSDLELEDAQRRDLVKAYFPTEKEGKAAGEGASFRNGLISVLPVPHEARIPVAQLRWIVGNMHVGTSDEVSTAEQNQASVAE